MEKQSKNLILKGKNKGIRFMCKTHFHLSMRLPCKKCVEEIGAEMPDPLPYGEREKKEFNNLLDIFGGKVDVPKTRK